MSDRPSNKEILNASKLQIGEAVAKPAMGLAVLGGVGLGIGFFASGHGGGWTALLTATVLIIGIAMVGPLFSAIFQLTGTKWGRAYRRLAEGSVVLMPIGLAAFVALIVGGNQYLPWVHEHPHMGGKAIWLTRGFWDARILVSLLATYSVGLVFVRLSMRRDFCLEEIKSTFKTPLSLWLQKGLKGTKEEAEQINKRMGVWAVVVILVYSCCFSMLGFDLIMALEPDWFSTLFGAWYFVGNMFSGLALLAVGALFVAKIPGMDKYLTKNRQSDLATLLIAFTLLNADFFWNQYLTIWYANLPEETFYLIERTLDEDKPWRGLSFVSLATFFFIPFLALLFRKVKRTGALLIPTALAAVVGVFLSRFIEIAPSLLEKGVSGNGVIMPLVAAALIFVGCLGGGLLLYAKLFESVPSFTVNDSIFKSEFAKEEGAQ